MNGREAYAAAAWSVAGAVDRIPAGAWDGPGLGAWDLRALVGHTSRSLVTVLDYLDRPAETVEVASPEAYFVAVLRATAGSAEAVAARGRDAGVALGPDPAAAFRALVPRATTRLAAAGDDEVIRTAAGGMRVRDYLPTRMFELVVHGLDVGDAAGVDVAFAPAVVAEASALAARIATELGHGPSLLRALTGRTSLPATVRVV